MLRRVVRVLRTVLCVLGALILVWIPVSWRYSVWASFPWPPPRTGVECVDAQLVISIYGDFLPHLSNAAPQFGIDRIWNPQRLSSLWPEVTDWTFDHFSVKEVSISLLLLAAICLAWPVTSFIVARRLRRGRGFEVEPAGTSNIEP